MNADTAARELAEATRARYAQAAGHLGIPVLLRRFNRRFWDALEAYERVREAP